MENGSDSCLPTENKKVLTGKDIFILPLKTVYQNVMAKDKNIFTEIIKSPDLEKNLN